MARTEAGKQLSISTSNNESGPNTKLNDYDEIRRIINLRGQGRETCRCVIAIAGTTLAETETKLKELHQFKDRLTAT
jgi:hypothetical protein